MAAQPVVDAVESYLAANFTAVPVIGLNNQDTPPPDGSSWLQVQYPVAKETFIGMANVGSRIFREDGAVRFVLNMPRGTGNKQGGTWIETLRDLFRAATIPVTGGDRIVRFLEAQPATTGDPVGDYWSLSFAAAYYFDVFK
jgi:hypothetical protein